MVHWAVREENSTLPSTDYQCSLAVPRDRSGNGIVRPICATG
jgi:hypothetical protein